MLQGFDKMPQCRQNLPLDLMSLLLGDVQSKVQATIFVASFFCLPLAPSQSFTLI